jgi:ABC transporter DrrB family efflux protein
MYTAFGISEDMSSGLISRLRSMPIPRSAVLVGRALADTGIQAWGLAVMVALGFSVGFRVHNGWDAALLAFALIILFGFVFEWVFTFLGMVAGSPQAAQGLSLLVFPFTFVSSAYVPVASMPSWLRGFADNQPVTDMVNSVRALTEGAPAEALLGHPASYFVVRSLLWCAAMLVVFVPLAVARYRRG